MADRVLRGEGAGMAHTFRPKDRVINGRSKATVVRLIADDALEVVYDNDVDREPQVEVASYFRPVAEAPQA